MDISKHIILEELSDAMGMLEKFPASEQQTELSIKLGDIMNTADALVAPLCEETPMEDCTRPATATFAILAEQIMDMIISGLIKTECVTAKDEPCLTVWASNSQEQIATHIQKVIQPEQSPSLPTESEE